MALHRVFIAFPISNEAKDELQRIQNELEPLNRRGRIRWSKPEGMHITLAFLGEINEEKIENIKKILENILKKYSGFSYWLSQIDAFPDKEQANVIVVKVAEEGRASAKIQSELALELKKIGLYCDNHPWHPHITLGRNKSHHHVDGLNSVKVGKIVWKVDKIELIKSELSSEGPKYTILESYSL